MGTTNILDLNNRASTLEKAITENAEDIHDSEKDIYTVMGQMGAKNLIPYPYNQMSSQLHGITFTVNNDGSITLSGTAEQNVNLKLLTQDTPNIRKILLNAGNIILSGGQSNSIYMQFWNYDGNNNFILNKENDTPISFSNQNANFNLVLYVMKDTAILTPITIYPMIRLASDTDDTYQPYAKTNRELTESYPANKVMMSDGVTSVEDALGGSNLTDITDWSENSSYPSGTALTPGNWTWIAHKVLPAGLYYISGVANLSTGTTTAVSLLQQIRDLTHNKVLIADSVIAPQRSFPCSCIVALTEPTDIYFDVYVGGSASVYARTFHAIKLF